MGKIIIGKIIIGKIIMGKIIMGKNNNGVVVSSGYEREGYCTCQSTKWGMDTTRTTANYT